MPRTPEITRLRELCNELVERAESDAELAKRYADGLKRLLASASSRPGTKRGPGQRRTAPLLDPFEVYRADPGALPTRLAQLDLEELRDIVAYYGMDPRRLVMKWKSADRVVDHIVAMVDARSRKGDVFRSQAPEPPLA